MGLYRVFKKDEEQGRNWAVMADDTAEAKLLVPKDLRIGFFNDLDKDFITVRTEESTYWGMTYRRSEKLKDVELSWKRQNKKGVLTEFRP
jgi:hypothetical protein